MLNKDKNVDKNDVTKQVSRLIKGTHRKSLGRITVGCHRKTTCRT